MLRPFPMSIRAAMLLAAAIASCSGGDGATVSTSTSSSTESAGGATNSSSISATGGMSASTSSSAGGAGGAGGSGTGGSGGTVALPWTKHFGGPGDDYPARLGVGPKDEIALFTKFGTSIDLGTGPLTSPDSSLAVAKLDA